MSSADEKIDAVLAAAALRKRRTGQQVSRQETAALRRVERATEETRRWEFYATVPQKHIRKMVGDRQTKQLQVLERRFGVPIAGRTCNIGAVLKRLYDIVADNSVRLLETVSDDPLWEGASQTLKDDMLRAQIKERLAKAEIAQLDLRRLQGRTIDLNELREFFSEAMPLLRDTGERMKRAGHADAHTMLNESLDALTILIDREFGDGNRSTT